MCVCVVNTYMFVWPWLVRYMESTVYAVCDDSVLFCEFCFMPCVCVSVVCLCLHVVRTCWSLRVVVVLILHGKGVCDVCLFVYGLLLFL